MCSPELAVAGFGATINYMGQQQQAGAVASAETANMKAQQDATTLQEQQINAQASDQMSQRAMQAQAALARLQVAAGENGVSGLSEDRNERAVMFSENQDMATLKNNRQAQVNQAESNLNSARAQAQGKVNQAQPNVFSSIGAGLQVYGASGGFNKTTTPKSANTDLNAG